MQLPDFGRASVLVAGDLMLDRYWTGGTSRISPEAPVPVVRVDAVEDRIGGAGNVAVNIAALGGSAHLVGCCGRDEHGDRLLHLLDSAGIHCRVTRLASRPTITKLRVLSRHQQLLRLDFEQPFSPLDATALRADFAALLADAGAVILSDYGKGTLAAPGDWIAAARAAHLPVLVDPKGSDFGRYRGATLLTPNRAEFEAIVGACATDADLVARGEALRASLELGALLVTRGEQGMTLLQANSPPRHFPALAKEVFDVTGAGDTVIAVLAAALAAGARLVDAVQLSNLAAGVVVGKLGTASVSAEELDHALHGARAHGRGVCDLSALLRRGAAARRQGEKIVATNGCFDILHPGHITYLRQARELGDRLVVLVNSDASVRRLKGPERPINPLDHRLTMLEALDSVDWVVPFDEDTPQRVIAALLPDVLVKGGDYADISQIAGHADVLAHGGEVRLLPFLEGHSTTRLIETIRKG